VNCCESALKKAGKWLSGFNQDGEKFRCLECKTLWVYVEDEAEGGAWHHAFHQDVPCRGCGGSRGGFLPDQDCPVCGGKENQT